MMSRNIHSTLQNIEYLLISSTFNRINLVILQCITNFIDFVLLAEDKFVTNMVAWHGIIMTVLYGVIIYFNSSVSGFHLALILKTHLKKVKLIDWLIYANCLNIFVYVAENEKILHEFEFICLCCRQWWNTAWIAIIRIYWDRGNALKILSIHVIFWWRPWRFCTLYRRLDYNESAVFTRVLYRHQRYNAPLAIVVCCTQCEPQ